MTLSDLSIKRPVFAWMLMAALIVFGWISFQRLGISQMPDVDFPVLNVNVSWSGAAPEIMETEIVDRIEQAVISVQGLRDMSSSIRQGQANITLEFELDRDIDSSLQEVQASISRIRLPLEVDPPTISKNNPDDQPIIYLGVSSKTRSLREIITFVDLSLKDQFQIIPGVGEITLSGFTERNLRIWVDNQKLKQYELTILDVQRAIRSGHIESAAGIIENDKQELNLRMMGEGTNPEEIGAMLITERGGRPIFGTSIRLQDIAQIEDGLSDIRRVSRVNGIPGIGLGIKKQRGSNAVEIGQLVSKKVEDLRVTLPPDIELGINFDSTRFIRESIEETEFTLVLSALATAVVCWLFLGSWVSTFNILLSIPTSIIGSFTVLYFMGFTLNFFTILGLALAIGIVVDDAIMVLENIYRHRDMGKDKLNAARDGAREITFAAVAASIAVVAIFLPVAFMKGIIGKFFFQFGITISTAVLLSLLEAITLTPMRCSQFMENPNKAGIFVRIINASFSFTARIYRSILGFCLNWRWLVLCLAIGIFIASLSLAKSLRKEFIPAQDQSMFLMRLQTPLGSSLEYTSTVLTEVEAYLKTRPEVRRYFLAVGGFGGGEVNTGMVFVSLKERKDRAFDQQTLMSQFRADLGKIQNLKVVLQDLSMRGFTAQRGFPVEFNIRGDDWNKLKETSDKIVERLGKTGLVADLDTDYRLGMPEVRVWPLRDKAAEYGVDVENLANTISAAIGGIREGKFTNGGRRYDVRIRLKGDERVSADDLLNLTVRNNHGELVTLNKVVKIETVPTLQTITRKNRQRSISIFANIAPGASQAKILEEIDKFGDELLPKGYKLYLSGSAQTFVESFKSLNFVLILGIVIAYMVLASQFNSFIHPFTVLLALPFSVTGALGALYLGDLSINLYSMIGMILLMGIVKKNSILLVEFANHKRDVEGLSVREALLEAGSTRLRPILMTSFTCIAAAIPPALALGPGAESRIPMSVAILGGMLVSTFFTLLVVPCAYSLLSWLERSDKAAKL
ncbi:efflux RND transporter permease subunit [bacterium]|nr:efflux RND transporter permease subunit [bacterium]